MVVGETPEGTSPKTVQVLEQISCRTIQNKVSNEHDRARNMSHASLNKTMAPPLLRKKSRKVTGKNTRWLG